MRWHRLGRCFYSSGQFAWMHLHASVPIAEHLEGDLFRVYFSSRDERNRSHTASLVLDINKPTEVLDIDPTPVITPGDLGTFDDS